MSEQQWRAALARYQSRPDSMSERIARSRYLAECAAADRSTTRGGIMKFQKHYVTDGVTKARVFYSLDNRVDGRPCVTMYAKDYSDGHALRAMFADAYKNDTDTMTDYFDEGKAVLFEGHPLYDQARARAEAEAS